MLKMKCTALEYNESRCCVSRGSTAQSPIGRMKDLVKATACGLAFVRAWEKAGRLVAVPAGADAQTRRQKPKRAKVLFFIAHISLRQITASTYAFLVAADPLAIEF